MANDPLDVIAESYRLTAETQQFLAQSQARVEKTQQYIAQTQRLGPKIQAFACVMIGASLLFLGYIIWQELAHGQEHVAQTRALLELVRRGQP